MKTVRVPLTGMKRSGNLMLMTIAALLMCPFLGGCLASINKEAGGKDVTVVRDLAYGADARQRMDVYQSPARLPAEARMGDVSTDDDAVGAVGAVGAVPTGRAKTGQPVIMFLYGGSWQEGSKRDYAFVAATLARHGYLTFVPDYRIYPDAHYPDFIRDAAHALAYVKAHAAQYGGDPSRVVIVGHSAGAYIAAMLALDARWLAEVGMNPQRDLTAVVGIAGPYDFLPLHDPKLEAIFTTPAGLPATQPITYVDGRAPPMLLMAGRNDKLVDPGNTERLSAAIRAAGGTVEEIMYQRAGHREIIGAFSPALRFLSSSFGDTLHYLDAKVAK